MPIYFLEFDPWKRVRGTNPARFVERRKVRFALFLSRNYEVAAGATPASRRHPASNSLPRAPLVNKSARTTRVASQRLRFPCNVCNGVSRKGEGGESDLVDINRIRERWLDGTGLFSIMTKISPVLDTKSVRLSFSSFFPFLLIPLRSYSFEERKREREREIIKRRERTKKKAWSPASTIGGASFEIEVIPEAIPCQTYLWKFASMFSRDDDMHNTPVTKRWFVSRGTVHHFSIPRIPLPTRLAKSQLLPHFAR